MDEVREAVTARQGLSDEELSEIEALFSATTQEREWRTCRPDCCPHDYLDVADGPLSIDEMDADTAWTAAMHNVFPALLADLRSLRERLAKAEAVCESCCEEYTVHTGVFQTYDEDALAAWRAIAHPSEEDPRDHA